MVRDTHAAAADVLVIGGGLIGGSIALRLAKAKLRVCVLDRGEPGAEASTAAAGMVAPHGETVEPDAFFEFCAASRDLYPSFVAEVEELSGRPVGYHRDGSLLVALDDEHGQELDRAYQAQTRLGVPLERLSPQEAARRVPGLSPSLQAALFVPGDHWLDNDRLTHAVLAACRRLGVTILAGRPVTKLNLSGGRVESVGVGYVSTDAGSSFSAEKFVLAAGAWSGELVSSLGLKLPTSPCRGQMLEFDAPAELPCVVRSGIHYMVPRAPKRVLVGTTAEYVGYEKAVTGEGLQSILAGAARLAPQFLKGLRFRRAWAGLRPDTPDHLPILGYGEIANLVFATGHFRNGILLAPITAQLISELILTGQTSRSLDRYGPTRFA